MTASANQARIHYVIGDCTQPVVKPALIIHSCNNVGAWGSGFVKALSARWDGPEQVYHRMDKKLGTMNGCEVEPGIYVLNLILQEGVDENRRTSMLIVEDTLNRVYDDLLVRWPPPVPSIHMPRMCCDRGRLSWRDDMETAITYAFPNCDVYVYDLSDEDRAKHEPAPKTGARTKIHRPWLEDDQQ